MIYRRIVQCSTDEDCWDVVTLNQDSGEWEHYAHYSTYEEAQRLCGNAQRMMWRLPLLPVC